MDDNLKRVMRLPLRAKGRLAVHLLTDPRVPWYAKALLPGLLLYLAMPLDLIPDFIPVLGQLDDLLVIALGGWLLIRLCPKVVIEDLLRETEGLPGP